MWIQLPPSGQVSGTIQLKLWTSSATWGGVGGGGGGGEGGGRGGWVGGAGFFLGLLCF